MLCIKFNKTFLTFPTGMYRFKDSEQQEGPFQFILKVSPQLIKLLKPDSITQQKLKHLKDYIQGLYEQNPEFDMDTAAFGYYLDSQSLERMQKPINELLIVIEKIYKAANKKSLKIPVINQQRHPSPLIFTFKWSDEDVPLRDSTLNLNSSRSKNWFQQEQAVNKDRLTSSMMKFFAFTTFIGIQSLFIFHENLDNLQFLTFMDMPNLESLYLKSGKIIKLKALAKYHLSQELKSFDLRLGVDMNTLNLHRSFQSHNQLNYFSLQGSHDQGSPPKAPSKKDSNDEINFLAKICLPVVKEIEIFGTPLISTINFTTNDIKNIFTSDKKYTSIKNFFKKRVKFMNRRKTIK